MSSCGSAARSARTTVRPPRPESNTPSGAGRRAASPAGALAARCGDASQRHARLRAEEQLEHRHAHGDAGLDLIEDHAALAVGDARVELDAAVHRPGMHHDGVGLRAREHRRVEAEGAAVLARRRHHRAGEALVLDAEHHHDVGAFDALRRGAARRAPSAPSVSASMRHAACAARRAAPRRPSSRAGARSSARRASA